MYKFLSKNGLTLAAVIGGVLSVAFLAIANSTVPENLGPDSLKNDAGKPMGLGDLETYLDKISSFDVGFYSTYVFLGLAVAAAVLLSLWYFVTNFSLKSLRTLIPIIVLAVVFFVVSSSYGVDADSYTVKTVAKTFEVDSGDSKIISGGITTAIFALFATVASVAVTEVINFFK